MGRVGVAGPVGVDRPTAVVTGGVIVRVRMDERSGHGCCLDRERQREGDDLPHDASLFVTPAAASSWPAGVHYTCTGYARHVVARTWRF
jgi:hypothetical protein